MRHNSIPLRAELLDIANCILDGADALVLSAETAVGDYPVDTVECMATTCKEAEACVWTKQVFHDMFDKVFNKLFYLERIIEMYYILNCISSKFI